MTVNRKELQDLAETRLLDAKELLSGKRWSGAYYLSGYAVECALKACVLVYVENNTGVIFEDRKYLDKCWTHDFETLVTAADLKTARHADIAANLALGKNWLTVNRWSEVTRYQNKTESEARLLYDAITDHTDGVLPWIKVRW
jgi:hypothetical protein